MSGIMNDRINRLQIMDWLRLNKNATLDLEAADGSVIQLTAAELALLPDIIAGASAANEVVSAANVIAASESRKTFFLNNAAGFTSTLPAPALGLDFEFIVAAAPTSGAYNIATNGGADIIRGSVSEVVSATGPVDQNADNVAFASGVALPGDRVRLISDGTSWFLSGQVQVNNAVVLSTT